MKLKFLEAVHFLAVHTKQKPSEWRAAGSRGLGCVTVDFHGGHLKGLCGIVVC